MQKKTTASWLYEIYSKITSNHDIRGRALMKFASAAAFARLISLCSSLLAMPFAIRYLGPERYGMWMTISAGVALLTILDLGIGFGLQTLIGKEFGKKNYSAIRKFVSSAFFLTTSIATILCLSLVVFDWNIRWESLLNIHSPQAIDEAPHTVAILLFCLFVSLPLSITAKIQLGLRQGHISSIWESIGSAVSLLSILTAIYLGSSLPCLAFCLAGIPLFFRALNAIHYLGFLHRDLLPTLRDFEAKYLIYLMRTSVSFLILQIAMLVGFQSDALIVSHFLGAEKVAVYSVSQKLFSIPGLIAYLFLSPLWPIYSETYSRGDFDWIRKAFSLCLHWAFPLLTLGTVLLALLSRPLIEIFFGAEVVPPESLVWAFFFWSLAITLEGVYSTFLNGLQFIKLQIVLAICMAFTNVALSIYLTGNFGIVGAAWGTVLSVLFCYLIPAAVFVSKFLAQHKNSSHCG